MNNAVAVKQTVQSVKLLESMAIQYGMEAKTFYTTVLKTCMPANATNEEFAAFLLVANKYKLNPITKEIYAFPKKGGGIQPIVGIDGWMNLINSHPECDGIQFDDLKDSDGKITAIKCRIFRKDRTHPIEVTEYLSECSRQTEPWQKWPARMLRHKAAIQCARYAFGFAGIIDPDEAERSPVVMTDVVAPPPPPPTIEEMPNADTAAEGSFEVSCEPSEIVQFYEEFDRNLQLAEEPDDVEQIWADMDGDRICADDDGVGEKIKLRRMRELANA